jgi:hypothetical protein
MTEQNKSSFVFTKNGRPHKIVNHDGTQVRLRSNPHRISERCNQLLDEYNKLEDTKGYRYLLTRLLKIFALSRELVLLLTDHAQRDGRDGPYVYMGRDGHIEFTHDYNPKRLEGEHFKIISGPKAPSN